MKKPRARRRKMPKHRVETRAWRFALRLDQDLSVLHAALDIAWSLRNDLAAERRENGRAIRAARAAGITPPARVTKRYQEQALAERRKRDAAGAGRLHSLVVKNIADRVDEGWRRFWEALGEGRKGVAPPRPVKRDRYRSLTYPQYGNGARLSAGLIHLSGLGSFRLHDHRKVRGRPKTVTLKWAHGRWWCIITSEIQAADIHAPSVPGAVDVGADPGLGSLLTFSDGRIADPPKALDAQLSRLRRAQRSLSRKFEAHKARQAAETAAARAAGRMALRLPLPNRLKRQIGRVGKVHAKAVNIRDHWHKLIARRTADRYGRVACEDHGLAFMIRNRRLARRASDRAIAGQKQALAAALGPRFVLVPNHRPGIGGNSQTCICDAQVPKTLKDRHHDCASCGLSAPRDIVSANIVEMIAFGTTHLRSPGRGSSDAEGANPMLRESAAGPGSAPVRAPGEASTSTSLSSGHTAGGRGLRRKARPAVIGSVPLTREPTRISKETDRKHPTSVG